MRLSNLIPDNPDRPLNEWTACGRDRAKVAGRIPAEILRETWVPGFLS